MENNISGLEQQIPSDTPVSQDELINEDPVSGDPYKPATEEMIHDILEFSNKETEIEVSEATDPWIDGIEVTARWIDGVRDGVEYKNLEITTLDFFSLTVEDRLIPAMLTQLTYTCRFGVPEKIYYKGDNGLMDGEGRCVLLFEWIDDTVKEAEDWRGHLDMLYPFERPEKEVEIDDIEKSLLKNRY